MAAGPHPRRVLTLTPRLGFTVLGSVWPQALPSQTGLLRRQPTRPSHRGFTIRGSVWPQALLSQTGLLRHLPTRPSHRGFTIRGSVWPQALPSQTGLLRHLLERVSHRCSGRPLGRPSDGLKPVAYTHVKNAVTRPSHRGFTVLDSVWPQALLSLLRAARKTATRRRSKRGAFPQRTGKTFRGRHAARRRDST